MKKITLSIITLQLFTSAYSQVGINTEEPTGTFHVVATSTNSSTAEGIIAPNLTRNQLISKDLKYTSSEKGAIIYVTDLSGTLTDKTSQITNIGYYYFDGSIWQPFGNGTTKGSWLIQGSTTPAENNTDNIYQTGSVGIGTNTAVADGYKLQVEGNEYINGTSKIGGLATAKNTSAQLDLGDKNKGFLPNRVALVSTTNKSPVTNAEAGMLVYNTATVKTENLYPGLYIWDGTKWNLYYNDKNLNVANGITLTRDQNLGTNALELGGTLNKKTRLIVPSSNNFEVKASASINSSGGNLIVTDKGNVGINVAEPKGILNTNGSVYLQNLNKSTVRTTLGMNPFLTVNVTDTANLGRVEILDSSLFGLAGGFRPPLTNIVQTVDTKNSIVNVNFVYHVDNSSSAINRTKEYYVYGNFTIISAEGECRIVDVSLKDYYGKDIAKGEATSLKLACSITDNSISWNYPGLDAGQGTQTIKLDSTTGELSVIKGTIVFSYLFQFFGGIR